MYEQVEKPKENKSRVVTNSVTQKNKGKKQCLGIVDNRQGVIASNPFNIHEINNIPYSSAMQLHSIQRQVTQKENSKWVSSVIGTKEYADKITAELKEARFLTNKLSNEKLDILVNDPTSNLDSVELSDTGANLDYVKQAARRLLPLRVKSGKANEHNWELNPESCFVHRDTGECSFAQIRKILEDKTQGTMNTDLGYKVHHIAGREEINGKPVWIIKDKKISLLGLYTHSHGNLYIQRSGRGPARFNKQQ